MDGEDDVLDPTESKHNRKRQKETEDLAMTVELFYYEHRKTEDLLARRMYLVCLARQKLQKRAARAMLSLCTITPHADG